MEESSICIPNVCVPCTGKDPPLDRENVVLLMKQVPQWHLAGDGLSIRRKIRCKNFLAALSILNTVGEIAEREGHHPDFSLMKYYHLTFTLTTHASKGLTMNDFTMARLIDSVL